MVAILHCGRQTNNFVTVQIHVYTRVHRRCGREDMDLSMGLVHGRQHTVVARDPGRDGRPLLGYVGTGGDKKKYQGIILQLVGLLTCGIIIWNVKVMNE